MGKKRVYEIAKKEGVTSTALLEALRAAGVEVKAAASTVDESLAKKALGSVSKNGASSDVKDRGAENDGKGKPGQSKEKQSAKSEDTGKAGTASTGKRRRVVIDAQASRRQREPLRPPVQRKGRKGRKRAQRVVEEEVEEAPVERVEETVRINSGSTVKDVAAKLDVSVAEIIKELMNLGEMASITQSLTDEAMGQLAEKLEKSIEVVHVSDETELEAVVEDSEEDLSDRPPVVVVMGHVDHGKTSLLDAIRETEVVEQEAGGITQHIGAYQVHHGDKLVTFLDTPGHEAFTAMRARGAKVTDVAVVVVAADDGVKPQTVEAIDHANAAGVPILIAVNKIDKEAAAPDKVRTELASMGLNPEDWGGDTVYCDVSAKTKQGIDNLLEMIILVSEIQELKANVDVPASGTVIESRLDPGRGAVATMLIQRGKLHVGDALIVGANWAKVRAMHSFTGQRIESAEPSTPVEILGFNSVPSAGDHGHVVESEREARLRAEEVEYRIKAERIGRQAQHVSLEDLFERAKAGGIKQLNLVLKTDVAGSLEALEDELAKTPQDEIEINTVHKAVGAINESDVMLAAASEGVVLAFNVRPTTEARAAAEREGVEIRTYTVIYKLVDELKAAMEGLLEPEEVEEDLGVAEVREVFQSSRLGAIAGCYVTDGKIPRNARVRVVRDGSIVYESRLASLKRFKEDVREVDSGFECGIVVEKFSDVKKGDLLEAFDIKKIERRLS